MDESIRIFIGTEDGNQKAEKALHYSIIKNCKSNVDIYWMSDKYKDSVWDNWNKGRDDRTQNSGVGWKTNFSVFRWAIPELCNYSGKAIYLDVDQIVLKDIEQMWNLDIENHGILAINEERTDVMLMNCSKFKADIWPKIQQMKPSGRNQKHYRLLVQKNLSIGILDKMYNCLDGKDFDYEKTRLVHYTKMNTQPWRPFPEAMEYKEHSNKQVESLWYDYYKEALEFEAKNNYILGSPDGFFDLKSSFDRVSNSAAKYLR